MTIPKDFLFGIPLTTHRSRDVENANFLYESAIAAFAVFFTRTTIYMRQEPSSLRWFFGLMLAFLAYSNKSYELISTVEIFSYAVPLLLFSEMPHFLLSSNAKDSKLIRLFFIALSAIVSLILCHVVASGALFHFLRLLIPTFVWEGLAFLFPVKEVMAAYEIIDHFVTEPNLLQKQVARLFFVTCHIQVGMGYLGISFLKQEQQRRNQLVRMDMVGDEDCDKEIASSSSTATANGENAHRGEKKRASVASDDKKLQRARRFQRSAAPFIFFTAVPYMLQIIGYGNLNAFAYSCFKDDVHRAVRLYNLFDHDNHLVAMSAHSAKGPEGTFTSI